MLDADTRTDVFQLLLMPPRAGARAMRTAMRGARHAHCRMQRGVARYARCWRKRR